MTLPGSLELNRRLSSWIEIQTQGLIALHTGKVEIGQGILTAIRQMAADELGISLEQIEVISATTSEDLDEAVTSGSRSIQESGLAIRHACACIRSLYFPFTTPQKITTSLKIRTVRKTKPAWQ